MNTLFSDQKIWGPKNEWVPVAFPHCRPPLGPQGRRWQGEQGRAGHQGPTLWPLKGEGGPIREDEEGEALKKVTPGSGIHTPRLISELHVHESLKQFSKMVLN